MPQYNERQQIFCLNRASNMADFFQTGTIDVGSEEELQSLVSKRLKALLSDKRTQNLIGEWEIVWGPAIHQHGSDKSQSKFLGAQNPYSQVSLVADNGLYIAKYQGNSPKDRYVIAITETNAFSWYGWLVENSFAKSTTWNKGKPWLDDSEDSQVNMRIGDGSSKVLEIIYEKLEYDKKSFLDYLRDLVKDYDKGKISIAISGHSQGAVLTPLVALSLIDRRSEWDPEEKVDLLAVPTAFSAIGNAEFAKYYESKLLDQTDAILNKRDLLTTWWSKETIGEGREIYAPDLRPNTIINSFIDLLLHKVRDEEYHHVTWKQEQFDIGFQPDASDSLTYSDIIDLVSNLIGQLILHYTGIGKYSSQLFSSLVTEYLKPLLKELDGSGFLLDRFYFWGPMGPVLEESVDRMVDILCWNSSFSLDSDPEELKMNILRIFWGLPNFINYILQELHQHEVAFIKYLEVPEFFELIREISQEIKYGDSRLKQTYSSLGEIFYKSELEDLSDSDWFFTKQKKISYK